jgi:Fic family protein
MDGNGRIGRFLTNVMLAAGGYPWTVIPVEQRTEYMQALEAASVGQNIGSFIQLLGRLVQFHTSQERSPKADRSGAGGRSVIPHG